MKPRHDFNNFNIGTDFSDITVNVDRSPTELALIKCYQCNYNNHTKAYECGNVFCPLFPIKAKYMRKKHVLSPKVAQKASNNIKQYLKTKNN